MNWEKSFRTIHYDDATLAFSPSVTVGSKEVTLNLYDTAGECVWAVRVLGSACRVSP